MMQVWLDATPLFRCFGFDEGPVAVDVVERLYHGPTIEVELASRIIDVPSVGMHVRN